MTMLHWKHNPSIFVMVAALFGSIIATGQKTQWQDPIESAQVLAGIVNYPTDNPFYIFHTHAWTLLNQISAYILSTGVSDYTASQIIGGIVGGVSFAGVFLVVYAISRNPLIALLTPMLMYSLSMVGASNAYPIALLGSSSSYGVLGLSFMLLVIGLLGSSYYRSGAFLAGLAIAIHPGVGAFCVLVVSTAVIANHREFKPIMPQLLRFFALGMLVTAASLGWQIYHSPFLQKLDPTLKRSYLEAFIRNFDYHRNAGSWVTPAFFLGIMAALLSFFAAKLKNVPVGASLIFSSVIASVATTIAMLLAAKYLPAIYFLKILIPWRYINFANICILPLCFGILASDFPVAARLRSMLLMTVICSFFAWRLFHIPDENIPFYAILILLLGVVTLRSPDIPVKPFAYLAGRQNIFLLGLIVFLVCRQVIPGIMTLPSRKDALHNWTNTEIYQTISKRPGLLLTAGGMHLVQLVTRRPVLLDGGALDLFPYILDTGPHFNDILRKVYGVDIFVKPPENARSWGSLTFSHQQLWEQRAITDWVVIRKAFGVTDILTPDMWQLQLPEVARGAGFILYTIPEYRGSD